jgi:transcription initiation factor TFIIH subunit 2
MADSDEEYVGSVTDDEDDFQVTRTDQTQPRKRKQRGGAEWELSRTWESLVEGADGTISSTVEGLLEASKRKRSDSFSKSSGVT